MSHGKRNQKTFRQGSLRRKIAREERENSAFAADTAFVLGQEATVLTWNQELALKNQAAIRQKNDEEARERAWAERVKNDKEIAKWLLKPAESKELSAKALRRRHRTREKGSMQ
ncbi:hypothetical protein EBZ80_22910 [bacterium]|nr:hypothetical protein [bacterium]